MKIKPFIQKMTSGIRNYRVNRHQKYLNKYAQIHDRNLTYGSYEKMREAREVIANYAKHNGVKVDIFDARHQFREDEYPISSNTLSDKINIVVTDLKSNSVEERIIPIIDDNESKSAVLEVIKRVMIDIPSDGVQKIVKVKSHFEENFLRNLYRNISEMTEMIKQEKNLPIDFH